MPKDKIEIEITGNDVVETITLDKQKVKSLFFTSFNGKECFGRNLWTKTMNEGEMEYFVFQTLCSLANMIRTANKDKQLARDIDSFAMKFGLEAGVKINIDSE